MIKKYLYCWKAAAAFVVVALLCGCTAKQYRKSADKQVYKIIHEKQQEALGKTNAFTIDTPYSSRKPDEVKAPEIIADRQREGKQVLTLTDALQFALQNNRQYQLRKENLYLSALSLTRERWAYMPQFFARSTVSGERDAGGSAMRANNRIGMETLFKTGGRVSLDIANDLLRFTTGGRRDQALTTIGLSLAQPLLRGAGAAIVAENLTQAERNVIYGVRTFSYYQETFAYDILATYLRLLQQQDTVKNQYNNYLSRVALRERSVALAYDRLAPFQADLARQEELSARNSYILAVERYRSTLDQFKVTLGLPVGIEIQLDDRAIQELEAVGVIGAPLTETQSFKIALDRRLDLLNEIDAFEDSKRRIKVTANNLRPGVLLFADAGLQSDRVDYAKFDLNDYRVDGGIQIDLPLDRRVERNSYRSSIISFEQQVRSLALFLDDLKNDVRSDIRTLEQSRQSYEIQKNAKELAERRVESSNLSLQAGRIQVRDVVDAQNSLLQANNAATAALVDYHLTRLRLLLDLGVLRTDREKFWLERGELPATQETVTTTPPAASNQLVTPEELFKNEKQ
jgi:outer membrane protein TolC